MSSTSFCSNPDSTFSPSHFFFVYTREFRRTLSNASCHDIVPNNHANGCKNCIVRGEDHTTTKPVCACPQQNLKESVEVAFAPNRPNYVHPSQAVVLPLVLKNVPTLEVSVYEVSTAAVYQVRGGRAVSRYCFKPGVLPWSCFRLQTRVNCKQAPSTCMALCLISAAPSRTITTPCTATLSPSSSQRWVPAVKLGTPRRQCVRTAALVCSCVSSCAG